MHNNYYFLRKLSSDLGDVLVGCVVSESFSQNKDELILRFETKPKSFFIKASLHSEFCCLSFPTDFNRARKNSVDLFGDLIGQRVQHIRHYQNERCFSIGFSNSFDLLFKMHGNRSNLVLFEQNQVKSVFRNHLTSDLDITLSTLDKEIDWSEEAFIKHIDNLKQHYFTFGKIIWNYLDSNGFAIKTPSNRYTEIQNVLSELDKPTYYLTALKNKLALSLVPVGNVLTVHNHAIAALNEFFTQHSVLGSLLQEKQTALSKLTTLKKNTESYLAKTQLKLKEIEADDHYKQWADLIMANLNQITPGMEKITLPDFYQNQKPVEIKLKRDLSAQKNAEVYYRKSKNHHIEVEKLKEAIERKQLEKIKLESHINQISEASDLKATRNLVSEIKLKQGLGNQKVTLPYHEIEFKGYKILIGKNSKSNDELTQKYTYKEDLWLHAKDVPGSHVVVKYQSGKNFPKEVIERAAQVAAFNSKRKTDTLCPVIYTPKKNVRKRKGDPPGTVIVEREKVIMVQPSNIV